MNKCEVPALDIDKVLFKGREMFPRAVLERRIVANLISFMAEQDFRIHSVWDGEELERPKTMKEAMELIFNLDEVSLRFVKNGGGKDDWHGVLLILGEGETIITDWNYFSGDKDNFDAAMSAFCNRIEELF